MGLREAALWRSMGRDATGDSAMNGQTPVTITDLRIPFFRLMVFFVKAGLAAIPAAIIVAVIVTVIAAAVAVALGGSPGFMIRRWTL
jgi:hypothetical protein